jgi:hypothetical protein
VRLRDADVDLAPARDLFHQLCVLLHLPQRLLSAAADASVREHWILLHGRSAARADPSVLAPFFYPRPHFIGEFLVCVIFVCSII